MYQHIHVAVSGTFTWTHGDGGTTAVAATDCGARLVFLGAGLAAVDYDYEISSTSQVSRQRP